MGTLDVSNEVLVSLGDILLVYRLVSSLILRNFGHLSIVALLNIRGKVLVVHFFLRFVGVQNSFVRFLVVIGEEKGIFLFGVANVEVRLLQTKRRYCGFEVSMALRVVSVHRFLLRQLLSWMIS